MTRPSFFIDLFAGLGGASQAFVVDVEWHVLQLDNNEALLEYNPDLVMCDISDIRATVHLINEWLASHGDEAGDRLVVWASPPCLEFSKAYSAPAMVAKRQGNPFKPDLSLVVAARGVATCLPVSTWIVENVEGAVPHFTPWLGKPRQRIGSFYLWGNFPLLSIAPEDRRHTKQRAGDLGRHSPIRSNLRAKVPLAYSQALLDAITNQTGLDAWA